MISTNDISDAKNTLVNIKENEAMDARADFASSNAFYKAILKYSPVDGWKITPPDRSGSISWQKGKIWLYATPNWDGQKGTPIDIQTNDGKDFRVTNIDFNIDLGAEDDVNAKNYIEKVVKVAIKKIPDYKE